MAGTTAVFSVAVLASLDTVPDALAGCDRSNVPSINAPFGRNKDKH